MNIIQICDARYEVKIENGLRMIKYNGNWITYSRFVDRLADDDHWDQLCELAKLGQNIKIKQSDK